MINDCWERLLGVNNALAICDCRSVTLAQLATDETVIEVYADDVEQAMFIVAANRMAELLGIACFRLDIEEGNPQMVFSFGATVVDAKKRMERHFTARQVEVELGLDIE